MIYEKYWLQHAWHDKVTREMESLHPAPAACFVTSTLMHMQQAWPREAQCARNESTVSIKTKLPYERWWTFYDIVMKL